ncbi:hypothetical protein [Oceanirhabdus seepicola]|uniref:Thioredoxin domain-containing protein n=1 Tax=Oceanirhabdus seepicola TaxID=2828781 RepID=A0A9J6P0W9_9CLOT|nr:hypothetical protein [Oceanirhabdus seepicola]MCM1989753.1 hypothetical protein [Oceanirhabdus seepicola]
MEKKKFRTLIGVLALVLVVLLFKCIFQVGKKDISLQYKINLKSQYENFKKSNKPSMIVFSYNADCCPNTKKFFDEYNGKVEKLMMAYEDKINIWFINTGILEEKDEEALQNITEENEVSKIPSILLMDSSGKSIKVIQGIFDEGEVREIIDGMVK